MYLHGRRGGGGGREGCGGTCSPGEPREILAKDWRGGVSDPSLRSFFRHSFSC